MLFRASISLSVLLAAVIAGATIFGSVHGLVHDPQHRPLSGAQITLKSVGSDWSQTTSSNLSGEFQLDAVPVGEYQITVRVPGFNVQQARITVLSGHVAQLHFAMNIAPVQEHVEVRAGGEQVDTQSSTSTTMITRSEIANTPGATRANSLAMITDYVPGAYVVHDQLHVRGGHQVTWLIDGVPVPNTNIASNVGPQFDPKDMDYVEAQRGGYSAEYGDRTFGVFNVVTRSGFERHREGELIASYGTQNQTDDQLSFGSHTDRFAYYASLSANRTDLGLEPPIPDVLHDLSSGVSGFTSLIFNETPQDQFRLVASLRGDHYQVPNTPDQQLAGIRDVDNERDAFVNFTWAHTSNNGLLLTVSPLYHFNRAHYDGRLIDTGAPADLLPTVVPNDDRSSNYAGGVVALGVTRGRHNAHLGFQGLAQHDSQFLGLTGVQTPASFRAQTALWGDLEALFAEDQFRLTNWLTLNGGLRFTHFSGGLSETATDPRIGVAIQVPKLNVVVHGAYGRYYQAPPLLSVGGPVLELAASQGFGFLPLRGERDQQWEVGMTVPAGGWVGELTYFQTRARNFFDHDVLGNSNIFFPVTLATARIRGFEATVRSPKLPAGTRLHLAYSNQRVQGHGGVSGGLTDFAPLEQQGWYYLDHDQRHTLSAVLHVDLPWHSRADGTLAYGSGFLNGDGPAHLPAHTTFDLALGKTFGERFEAELTALNLTNRRYLLDNSNTFGGTHWANPREVAVRLKWRFKY